MLKKLVASAVQQGASDIHIEPHLPVTFRIFGTLERQNISLASDEIRAEIRDLLDTSSWQDLEANGSVDVSVALMGVQCRTNVLKTDRGFGLAIRLLSNQTHTLNSCNLHPCIGDILKAQSGLILVTGATGAGKSTTLAAMIEELNQHERQHIITLESPIEYRFSSKKSLIRQRQIGVHTPSVERGILDALREDPDVLVVSEMRDPQAFRLGLNAAETGHLVIGTMHSANAAEALYRIMMSFSPEHQFSVLAQLADSLVAVVSQKLILNEKQNLRVPQCEILMNTLPVKTVIRKGDIAKLSTLLQSGGPDGQWTFERYKTWLDQKKDWQLPPPPQFQLDEEESSRVRPSNTDFERPSAAREVPRRADLRSVRDIPKADAPATGARSESLGVSEPTNRHLHQSRSVSRPALRHQEQAEVDMVMSQLAMQSAPMKRDPVTGLKVHADGRFDIPAVDVDLNELVKKIKVEE